MALKKAVSPWVDDIPSVSPRREGAIKKDARGKSCTNFRTYAIRSSDKPDYKDVTEILWGKLFPALDNIKICEEK